MIKNPLGRKINVLVVPSDRTGVSYFRSTKPHIYLEQKYPDDFHVDIEYEAKLDSDEWLKQYDIIHYHRTLGAYEKVPEVLERLDKLGILTFMDIDDHWEPGSHHPAHRQIKASGVDKLIADNVKSARNVLTTTPIFAEEMKRMNENIFVIPNAIDPNEKQYISKPTEHPRLRIGWLGGSSHFEDLKLLRGVVRKLKSDKLLDKVQFVLCGYDLRGSMIDTDRVTGKQTQRNIRPMESVWYEYEKIFTDNYSIVSPEYKAHLLKFTKDEYPDVENEPYKRVWTKPIKTYATNYNQFDVSLAPLCVNTFNKVKSQLKVIESGFHKKAIVAQDFGPYTLDLKTAKLYGGGFDETGNALTVDTGKNHKQWYAHIKFLIENPDKVELLAENLYNTVTERYSIDVTTDARRELYLQRLTDLIVEKKAVEETV
jgi:glycosyltransferase involved in cell wall biosynthesis